jgi:hypothetical protein
MSWHFFLSPETGPKNAQEGRFPSSEGWCRIVCNRFARYQEHFEIIARFS